MSSRPKVAQGSRRRSVVALAVLAAIAPALASPEMRIVEARSVTDLGPAPKGPAIAFSDKQARAGQGTFSGLTPFAEWARITPEQKALLALHPAYVEATVTTTVHGLKKTRDEKLQMYVAGARFVVNRPAASVDLGRLATLDTLERLDPAIRHKALAAADAVPTRDPEAPYNRRPDRAWCAAPRSACFESRYALEGKLPLGIKLANKLGEGGKPISDTIAFQSEVRTLAPGEFDPAAIARLTGLEGQVASVLEQSIFHVNQILRFGKLLAVVQPDAAAPERSVVSLYLAIGVKEDVLDRKKEFEAVPVLRNLTPIQVLMGGSSFNTGSSLSAGLPVYARTRLKTFAAMLEGN